MFDFLCSTSRKLHSQIKANSIDSSSVSKSIMFVIGGLCDCSPGGTENPNYTTASGMKIKGTYLVLMMALCQLNIKNIKSVTLNWDGISPSCRCVFLDDGNPVAHIHISFAGWSLDPCKHNEEMCPQEGFTDGHVNSQYDLSAKFGQQHRCTELKPQ
jgi:hypothetical protein